MSKMKITHQWWALLYPYKVEWEDAYKLHHTQAVSGTLENHQMQGPFYVMRSSVQHFLEALPTASFMGLKRPGCLYTYQTGRQPFAARSTSDGLKIAPAPPAIRMARKSDALMLKLACGGK